MTLDERLMIDLKDAMRAGDTDRREAIRMVRAALKNRQIELGRPLAADEEQAVVARTVKRHRESIEQFKQGNRSDLVAHEEAQMAALEHYLPQLMSREEIEAKVRAVLTESAGGPNAHGKVMATLAQRLRGKADLKEVNGVVQQVLASAGTSAAAPSVEA